MLAAIRFLVVCAGLVLLPAIAVAQPPPPPPPPPPDTSPIPIITAGQVMPELASGLIVWVHGCCTNTTDVDTLRDKLSTAYTDLLRRSKDWDIVVWDWSEHTSNSKRFLRSLHLYAQSKGGSELATAIEQSPNRYKHIHLIGHSAGANLIHEASQLLAVGLAGTPFLHLTFLDAYTPDNSARDKYGSFEIDYPHYSEHYVDKRGLAFTDETLRKAFNFDITDWIHSADEGGSCGHHWPLNWYIKSITQPA